MIDRDFIRADRGTTLDRGSSPGCRQRLPFRLRQNRHGFETALGLIVPWAPLSRQRRRRRIESLRQPGLEPRSKGTNPASLAAPLHNLESRLSKPTPALSTSTLVTQFLQPLLVLLGIQLEARLEDVFVVTRGTHDRIGRGVQGREVEGTRDEVEAVLGDVGALLSLLEACYRLWGSPHTVAYTGLL